MYVGMVCNTLAESEGSLYVHRSDTFGCARDQNSCSQPWRGCWDVVWCPWFKINHCLLMCLELFRNETLRHARFRRARVGLRNLRTPTEKGRWSRGDRVHCSHVNCSTQCCEEASSCNAQQSKGDVFQLSSTTCKI